MSDRLRQAEAAFVELSALPPEQWESGIARLCHGDDALAAEIRSLLDCHRHAGNFLDADELLKQSLVFGRPRPQPEEQLTPGTRIGLFTVRSVLGVGGMGSVYVAEQDRPRRTVAIKVIRRELSTASLLRRFEHEAEVLGRLQHPGIAQVFEAGSAPMTSPDGVDRGQQPFIAMELVRGLNLSKHAEEQALDTRARLELVAKICDAVHHAHQRGVIHRDLKPGNIIVEPDGNPKILDFGVARAADADLRVTTLQTSIGQLIGTLPYMSPEQVLGDSTEVDTRSDVYALGVILYQLLTGRLPHDVASRSIPDAARVIREESPTRLSSVSRMFRGEIDTIVSKALEKDKRRRYQSAADLAEDIRRHLSGDPILARQDSAVYILRKQLKRHKFAAAFACLTVLAAAGFAVFAGVQASAQRRLAAQANAERLKALAAKELADAALITAERDRNRADEAAARLKEELSLANIERGRLDAAMGNVSIAESILWREYLTQPRSVAARWAVWELLNRYPYEWTTQVPPWPRCGVVANDGSAAAVGGAGVSFFELSTGTLIRSQRDLGSGVACLAMAPGGLECAAGLDNGRLVRIDVRGDRARAKFAAQAGHGGAVRALAYSPDARIIATAGANRTLQLWDAGALTPIRASLPHTEPINALAFSPDGAFIATASRGVAESQPTQAPTPGSLGPGLAIWNAATLELVRFFPYPAGRSSLSIIFTLDGKSILLGTNERSLIAYDIESGAERSFGVLGSVASMSHAPALGGIIAAAGDAVYVIDNSGPRPIDNAGRQARGGIAVGVVPAQSSSPDPDESTAVVVVGQSGVMRRVSLRREPAMTPVPGFDSWCFAARYSPDGSILIVSGGSKSIRILDAATLSTLREVDHGAPALRTRSIRFLDRGHTAAVGSNDGIIRIIDTRTGAVLAKHHAGGNEIYAMDIAPDGRILAAGHADGTVRLWTLPDWTPQLLAPRLQRRVEGVAFSRDGLSLVTSGMNSGIQVWDVAKREAVRFIETSDMPWAVAYTPDGTRLAVTTQGGTVDVFDRDFNRVGSIFAHRRLIPGLDFSVDGRLMATGGEDGVVRLWDASTLRPLASLEPGRSEVVTVAFDPAASRLAAACALRSVAVYSLPPSDPSSRPSPGDASVDQLIRRNEPFHRERLGLIGAR